MAIWKEVTSDRYDEMLGAVPPAIHTATGFLVGEPYSYRECRVTREGRNTFMAFLTVGGRFYECCEPLTVMEFKAISQSEVIAT